MASEKESNQIDDKPKSAMTSPWIGGQSPRPPSNKSVSIHKSDSISPLMSGGQKDIEHEHEASFNLDRLRQQRRASFGLKVSPRPTSEAGQSHKARTPAEILRITNSNLKDGHSSAQASSSASSAKLDTGHESSTSSTRPGSRLTYHDLLRWIQKEISRRKTSKVHRHKRKTEKPSLATEVVHKEQAPPTVVADDAQGETSRRASDASSHGSLALETLQDMLEQLSTSERHIHVSLRKNYSSRSLRKPKRLSSTASSEIDLLDKDPVIPSCDVFLDNSKTLSYTGGLTGDDDSRPNLVRSISTREKGAWKTFKLEILKLTHTLKLKGWRSVPLEEPGLINVERLSGALTNAVYVVSPPKDLPTHEEEDSQKKSKPKKLLLRVYGSQVDHLIDRDSELQILKRLSKKHIGPSLLATFSNGRFEEFLNARALGSKELRNPETSRQIAKRMRELHDGVELLEKEVEAGPFVWQNINKWMSRAEYKVAYLEKASLPNDPRLENSSIKTKFVGAEFKLFKKAILKYDLWLQNVYKAGKWDIQERLVFAHNDAQYGNILRRLPSESPIIHPTNEHKQLVVIDFEYANANVPGHDIANHFTEWCYDYHDEESYSCKVKSYPTLAEQVNFLTAYVTHRPSFKPVHGRTKSSASSLYSTSSSYPNTPAMLPLSSMETSNSSVDSRLPGPAIVPLVMKDYDSTSVAPRSQSSTAQLPQSQSQHSGQPPNTLEEDSEAVKKAVDYLIWETRAWRGLNSAQWTLWGIVQAKVPGMMEDDSGDIVTPTEQDLQAIPTETVRDSNTNAESPKTSGGEHAEEEIEDEFDYLAYARERASFFWGDIISLGIMRADELPDEVVTEAQVLDY